jgi:16S rRNA (guanine527-N7)-methyltransferase
MPSEALHQEASLEQGLIALSIALPRLLQEKLLAYTALLYKWNRTYNLTALREPSLAVSHHLLDSLAILPYLKQGAKKGGEADTLLDVGSGGGLPGIPLAIACPNLRVTLLDSNSKKTAFLQQAAIELNLPNIAVHCGRVEQFRPPAKFSAITSRAFSELADFVALSRHLLHTDGRWLAMKGLWPQEEIARLPAYVAVQAVHRLDVPGVDGERHLVLMGNIDAQRCEGS